jgi:dipeptidyl aminopeptidase/acylaminoacyl peptidase
VEVGGTLVALAPEQREPLWTLADGVASPDGSAAYRVEPGPVIARFDTGAAAPTGRWPLPAGDAWRVVVVSPDGSHVVLTDGPVDAEHRPAVTRMALWSDGAPEHAQLIERPGALQPEALSPDGSTIFLLDHRNTYYRVRTLDVASGNLSDTFGRDKSPAEDMNGTAVHAALSPDGHILSTLYRVPGEPAGEPFVHILNLAGGWSYCADLPQATYTTIASSPDGRTVYVGASDGSWISIDLTDFDEISMDPFPILVHPPSSPPVPLAVGGSMVTAAATVTADATGVSWFRAGILVAHVDHPVDRLVALAPN